MRIRCECLSESDRAERSASFVWPDWVRTSVCELERNLMDHDAVKAKASEAICPLRQASGWSFAYRASCTRTEAGDGLAVAEAHFVFALLVDLLGFEDLGPSEKLLWSIPVEFDDMVFFIEHRKFGLGIFAPNIPHIEESARKVVRLINEGIRTARKFGHFKSWVQKHSKDRNVILINDSIMLYDRYVYFLELFEEQWSAFEKKHEEASSRTSGDPFGQIASYCDCDYHREQAAWLGQSAINCFFSWTEHIFIHLAMLLGNPKANTVEKCNRLIKSPEWRKKYRSVFNVDNDREAETYLRSLTRIRESKNFTSHGHFGKDRETLWVSTGIGFVPYNAEPSRSINPWRHNDSVGFTERESLQLIERFIKYLWSGARRPAYILLQERSYPTFFQFMLSGDYGEAMKSEEAMKSLVYGIENKFDIGENMDFGG